MTSEKESGLSQPSDSDFMGRAKKHPAKSFANDRPAPNPEQHSEDEANESKNGDGKRNYFSLSAARGWINFNGGGPWLEKAGGPLVVSLVVSGVVVLLSAAAWRLGLLWGQ